MREEGRTNLGGIATTRFHDRFLRACVKMSQSTTNIHIHRCHLERGSDRHKKPSQRHTQHNITNNIIIIIIMNSTEILSEASGSVTSCDDDDPLGEFMDCHEIVTGELFLLSATLEEQSFSDATSKGSSGSGGGGSGSGQSTQLLTSLNVEACYGDPLSPQEANEVVPPGNDGLVRHAIVIPDNFCANGRLLVRGLNKRDFDLEKGTIKPRRASLPITQTQLFSSLTKVDGPNGPRWIFNGVLNGWPSLRNFELIGLEKKRALGPLTAPDYLNTMRHTWSHYWSIEKEGAQGIPPDIKDTSKIYRAKLRGAPWSSIGWSPQSPGFLFWYEAQRAIPRVTYGTKAVQEVGDDRCSMVRKQRGAKW